jgi:membrane protein YqaA with SNARE-associated domain
MSDIIQHLLGWLLPLGGVGLLLLAIAESSFLFIPIGCDLLLIFLVTRGNSTYALYVVAAAAGSVVGVFLLDLACRRLGEEGLPKLISPRRLDSLKKRFQNGSMMMLVAACLAPPPFPFTGAIAVTSVAKYPRHRLLTIVFFARLARYAVVAWAGLYFGNRIVELAKSSGFRTALVGFAMICIAGTVFSVVKWWKTGQPAPECNRLTAGGIE